MPTPIIAPSILNADFSVLGEELGRIHTADEIHVDIMDGHFVPNLSFGPDITATVREHTSKPLDVHLMIEKPEKWYQRYIDAGADTVIFHVEATDDPGTLARNIHDAGAKAAICLKPGTELAAYLELVPEVDQVLIMSVEPGFGGQSFMPEHLDKVRTLRHFLDEKGLSTIIEIDGGISSDTIGLAAAAGVEKFVAGSAVYGSDDPAAEITTLRDVATKAGQA